MPDPVYKKIADLTALPDVQDSDQAEIQRGIAGYSVTFLTVWNWIKTKISNWSTVLQYLGDSGGKLTYKGSIIDKGAAGTSGQIQANISDLLKGITGFEYDNVNMLIKEHINKLIRRFDITTAAPFFTGTVTTGSTTTILYDTTKAFTGITGKAVLYTSGANQGQSRAILSFTSTSITVTEAFPFTPNVADAYEIIDTTIVTTDKLNSIFAFYVTNNHAVILPSISATNNGARCFYYVESLTAGKTVQFIAAQGQTIDKVSNNPNLAASREGVLQFAHNTAQPHWDTLAQIGLSANATNGSTASFSVTTTQTTFRELQNVVLKAALRFIAPTGNPNRLQYTSIIPRTLPVICVIDARSDTANSQIFTLKLRKFTKATGLTTDVDCAYSEVTLTSTLDISNIMVIGNVSFEIGDQVWAEVKNDSTSRNYTVLRSTMHVR